MSERGKKFRGRGKKRRFLKEERAKEPTLKRPQEGQSGSPGTETAQVMAPAR